MIFRVFYHRKDEEGGTSNYIYYKERIWFIETTLCLNYVDEKVKKS